jgi:molecular chaperone GrpE
VDEASPDLADVEVRDTAPEPEPDPLEVAKAELGRVRDQLLRTAADFDNFRKRSRREVADAETRARDEVFREMLPVFDNLERAMQHSEGTTDVQALADGIRMVMKQFVDTLGRMGIERVSAVGKPFDPAVHEAIQHLETAEFPPGTIAAEAQPGYRQGDRLLRPALVVVAKAPPDGPN